MNKDKCAVNSCLAHLKCMPTTVAASVCHNTTRSSVMICFGSVLHNTVYDDPGDIKL